MRCTAVDDRCCPRTQHACNLLCLQLFTSPSYIYLSFSEGGWWEKAVYQAVYHPYLQFSNQFRQLDRSNRTCHAHENFGHFAQPDAGKFWFCIFKNFHVKFDICTRRARIAFQQIKQFYSGSSVRNPPLLFILQD